MIRLIVGLVLMLLIVGDWNVFWRLLTLVLGTAILVVQRMVVHVA